MSVIAKMAGLVLYNFVYSNGPPTYTLALYTQACNNQL